MIALIYNSLITIQIKYPISIINPKIQCNSNLFNFKIFDILYLLCYMKYFLIASKKNTQLWQFISKFNAKSNESNFNMIDVIYILNYMKAFIIVLIHS
jgi:hypothetical protein